jgi:hypothetical protein
MKRILQLIILFVNIDSTTHAWTYPEHRQITLIAIQKLNSGYRAEFDSLWALARKGYEARLDASVADFSLGLKPKYLDYAAWPAIAGDHSNSSENMLFVILKSNWILKVANVGAILETGLKKAKNRSDRINKLSDSDLLFMRADPEYVSRAGANNGHFMLALAGVDNTAEAYFNSCFKEGCEINLVGTYKWFHASALLKACRLSNEGLTQEQRSALTLAALADEAFALHFLEDGFSSGHVAGVWGDASQRKGTHDYYNEKGLEITTWKGDRFVLMGDAFMQPEDAESAASTIRLSIEQFLDAVNGKEKTQLLNDEPVLFIPDTFDVAKAVYMPSRKIDTAIGRIFSAVLINIAVPGLATGIGELPRFRSEIGPFIGIAPAARVSLFKRGFGPTQNISGAVPDLELAVRFGLSIKGVLNESSDGLIFFDFGGRLDGASTMEFDKNPTLNQFGSVYSAIPSRDAYYFRLHLPFFLIPGDLLIVAPFLLLVSPGTLEKMAMDAANGGLIPWQSGIVTPIGRFQFVLGREIGISLFGTDRHRDSFIMPDIAHPGNQVLVNLNSTQIDFPILEYRLMRTFSSRQSASLVLQINAGMDIPEDVQVSYPADAIAPALRTIWFIGFRLAFDWRYYVTQKKS